MALFGLSGAVGIAVIASSTVCLTSGCSTIGYYAQSTIGHLNIMQAAKPVPQWLAADATPPALKERLELSQRMRDFAITELGEPDNASYRRYADLKRSAAVWNVVAAPELSLQLKTWCFAVVGCVGYRGYFDEADANAMGAELRAAGLEATVYGVPAYSTLGRLPGDWLADPLLNTFINYPEGDLAALIFHELAHQMVYVPGDTMFNESFATAVERIGSARWLAEHASQAARDEQARNAGRRDDFRTMTFALRRDLESIYTGHTSDDEKRAAKATRMAKLKVDYAAMKATRWNGYTGYDRWFANANNASVGVLAAYNEWVPAFEHLFARSGRDWHRFYAEVSAIAALPAPERRAKLRALGEIT